MIYRNFIISFVLALTIFGFFGRVAAEESSTTKEAAPAVKEAALEKDTDVIEEKSAEEGPKEAAKGCECAKSAEEALSKAYISLEEDEWPAAIKICTDAGNKIKELEKTCTCPVIPIYKDVSTAYLNYAKGGQILDGEEEIDCLKAVKLYDEATILFEKSVSKVLNEKLKKEVSLISDYCSEEKEFVQDECS